MKKKIHLLNIEKKNNIFLKEKFNIKFFYKGPWCKNNVDLLKENFNDTLNLYFRYNLKKYKNDIFFLEKNYNFLLKLLVKNLNIVHKKKYKKKFWEILISRWLFTWVNHVYFRWVYLKKITDKFEIKKYICNQIHPSYAIPVNTHEGHNLCRVDNK